MGKYRVIAGQNLYDIALHIYGSIEGIVDLQAFRLEKLKGHQIDDSYKFCYWCEEWAEDAKAEYNANRFYRR
jgi:hypothetical protein